MADERPSDPPPDDRAPANADPAVAEREAREALRTAWMQDAQAGEAGPYRQCLVTCPAGARFRRLRV
ncbi:MAG: hypothetical protein CL931_02460 [Deltaproteobacteria bacterium]|nr:hypothetical protein [Deltaproteobacteria bacterium]